MMSRARFHFGASQVRAECHGSIRPFVEAVGADDEQAVLDNQIGLDEDTAGQVKQALTQNERIEAVRPIVMNGQRRATSVTIFPITAAPAGIALDATEADRLREALTRHIRAH